MQNDIIQFHADAPSPHDDLRKTRRAAGRIRRGQLELCFLRTS